MTARLAQINQLAELAKHLPRNGGTAWDDSGVRQKIVKFACRGLCAQVHRLSPTDAPAQGHAARARGLDDEAVRRPSFRWPSPSTRWSCSGLTASSSTTRRLRIDRGQMVAIGCSRRAGRRFTPAPTRFSTTSSASAFSACRKASPVACRPSMECRLSLCPKGATIHSSSSAIARGSLTLSAATRSTRRGGTCGVPLATVRARGQSGCAYDATGIGCAIAHSD